MWKPEDVKESKKEVMKQLDFEDCRELNEYVGCKIERKGDDLKLTQPVFMQSLKDELELPDRISETLPVSTGVELIPEGELLSE